MKKNEMKILYGFIGTGFLGLTTTLSADIFFSEYIEGSSFNKAVEIYNPTESTVDLSNYTINLFSNGNAVANSSFSLSGTLDSHAVYVIAHASSDAAILNVADTTSSTVNFNGDDAFTLENNGVVVDAIGQVGVDPGSEWGTGDTSTKDNTIRRKLTITTGDTDASDEFNPLIEWDGFAINTLAGLGTYGGEVEPPVLIAVSIPEIQGAGHVSPYVGEEVITSGVVTAVDTNGFYLQDMEGDGNALTSDAILVFTNSAPTVSVGDIVEVQGNVTEYIPGGASTNNLSTTELTSPIVNIVSSGNTVPDPVIIGSAGIQPPQSVIDNDNFAIFDPSEDGIDFYESMEAMVVTVANTIAVSPTNRFNETFVLADLGSDATGLNSRGGITITETDYNPERIQVQLDNGLLSDFSLDANVGDTLGDVTGVINYAFGNFEVLMTQAPILVSGGLSEEVTTLTGDADHVTIATYNVENLDPVVEDISLVNSSSDIDDDVGDGKFAAIAAHLVTNLKSPDIIALQEMQDSDGAQQTGTVDADLTASTLIDAITTAGGPVYEYADIAPQDLTDGGQPGGNIRVGYLYNPARVSIDLVSIQRISDQDLSDGDAFESSRKSLYASFTFGEETLHLINNHFSSKGGSSPIFGQIQPFINGNVDKRDAQATIVNEFVDGLLMLDSSARIVVLGDLNEFYFEQPLLTLKGSEPVLANLIESAPVNERYSYIYQGNSQALDNTLVSNNIVSDSEFEVIHLNSEFSDQASDHDPSVLRLNIEAPVVDVPTIQSIRAFLKEQIKLGNIEGTGNRKWTKKYRQRVFTWYLKAAERAIKRNKNNLACRYVAKTINRSDGQGFDWIEGEAVAELNSQLNSLQTSLGCQ